MTTLFTFIAFSLAMIAAYVMARVLTALACRLAGRWGVVSSVTERSSHARPTPRLGGVGLAAGFALAAGGFLFFIGRLPHDGITLTFSQPLIQWIALGWLMMFTIGLLDDLFDLPPVVKLLLMMLAALLPIWGGGVLFNISFGNLSLPAWATPALAAAVTVLWILFFTNAFNFMDGMDGFAGSFARTAACFMFAVPLLAGLRGGALQDLRAEAYLLPLLAMACWGFLHWNRPPARVFMGDGGSLSVGYLLAIFPVLGARGSLGLSLSPLTSMTILMPFIFDVALTLIRRARRGENLLRAHREHLYQRLMRTGLTHAETLRINTRYFHICGAAALIGGLTGSRTGCWLGVVAALVAMLVYWRQTLRRERASENSNATTTP